VLPCEVTNVERKDHARPPFGAIVVRTACYIRRLAVQLDG
jgi:hypothetical protein